jgi:4-amino-4-deoxy-L-arabinose transferase-like glycosyltransferase
VPFPLPRRPVPRGLFERLKAGWSVALRKALTAEGAVLVVALGVGAFLRIWEINQLGLNSDEAVYAGQAGAIAGDPSIEAFFSAFRAHPLLFQTLLSVFFHLPGSIDLWGRLLSAAIGLATVFVTYELGKLLYGRRAGAIGALFLALMPYHVLVTRQILLDGPMTLFATLTLYMVARYAKTERTAWLYAAGAALGLSALSKETSVVLVGGIYAFLALTPEIRLRLRDVVGSLGVLAVVFAAFPIAISLAGKSTTGGNYLAWQLFRRPNHDWIFYPTQVPEAIGLLVVVAAAAGIWLLRQENSWRETLLLCWIAVPVIFFQIWPVKGFQYLLPAAPAVAILAARTLTRWSPGPKLVGQRIASSALFAPVAVGVIALTLVISSLGRIEPSKSGDLLAGSGGLPGGREAGEWIDKNVPEGAKLMTIGPSMANIVQFYGKRKAYGLAVSPNPLHRNPSYEPLNNPDRIIRDNEIQYVVWDSFSAARSEYFSRSLKRFADRYNGRVVYTETISVPTSDGSRTKKPLITIYEVQPS